MLEDGVKEKMINEITAAKADGDSVGGVLETAVYGFAGRYRRAVVRRGRKHAFLGAFRRACGKGC